MEVIQFIFSIVKDFWNTINATPTPIGMTWGQMFISFLVMAFFIDFFLTFFSEGNKKSGDKVKSKKKFKKERTSK
jgi:ATP-dependent Zn protease